jgi:hypothetical protein
MWWLHAVPTPSKHRLDAWCVAFLLLIVLHALGERFVGTATGVDQALPPSATATRTHTRVGIDSHKENTSMARAQFADPIDALRQRWDAIWSTDVSAADANVAALDIAAALIARAERGDLDAVADLVGAATWCVAGGPLVNVSEVGERRRACFERFGETLATREELERAALVWVLQLSAAGLDDATLYASALLRGIGADLLGGVTNDASLREMQRAQILGQLQTLADRGSADAASELHGHWRGDSALHLHDEQLAAYYAALTLRLDPSRNIVAANE